MQEKSTQFLAVAVSLIGLMMLYLVSIGFDALGTPINQITPENDGEIVKICGEVSGKRTSNSHIFLRIEDETGTMDVVIFNSTSLKLNGTGVDLFSLKSETVCITGLVEEYPQGSGNTNLIYRKSSLEGRHVL